MAALSASRLDSLGDVVDRGDDLADRPGSSRSGDDVARPPPRPARGSRPSPWRCPATACRPDRAGRAVASAVAATCLARLPICAPDWLISSTVAVISCTAATCCSARAACCCVEARISAAAAFRSAVAARLVRARSDSPATIAFSVAAEAPDLVGPGAASGRQQSPSPTCATKAITRPEGPDDQAVDGDPDPAQIRSVSKVPPHKATLSLRWPARHVRPARCEPASSGSRWLRASRAPCRTAACLLPSASMRIASGRVAGSAAFRMAASPMSVCQLPAAAMASARRRDARHRCRS